MQQRDMGVMCGVIVQDNLRLTMSNSAVLSSRGINERLTTPPPFPPGGIDIKSKDDARPDMEAALIPHPNRMEGTRHMERSLVPRRDAERRPEKETLKQTE